MASAAQRLAVLALVVLTAAAGIGFAMFAPAPGPTNPVAGDVPPPGTPDADGDRPGVVDADDFVNVTGNTTANNTTGPTLTIDVNETNATG